LIVVACNTASAAALHRLRQEYPQVRFVGMEPAVKPAAQQTHSGLVGVLATPATFEGELYASVVQRFAAGARILQNTCPGLVEQIEAGNLMGAQTRQILESALIPMLAEGIDTVVMGCTHYPFVIPLIEQIVARYRQISQAIPPVQIIDPAPAVARQVARLLPAGEETAPATFRLITSGDTAAFQRILPILLGENGVVEKAVWGHGRLLEARSERE
jgi:glutamate racemase